MALRYTLAVYETVTGNRITTLPYSQLSWNTPLDNTGKCSATIPLTSRELNGIDVRSLTTPWRYALLVSAGTSVQWFGPITPGRSYDGDGTITLPASELWAILKARLMIANPDTVGVAGAQPVDLTLTADDLPSLAVRIVQHALAVTGGALPLRMPEPVPGDAHTRTFEGTQITTAETALTNLTEVDNGPDVRFDGAFTDGDPRRAHWVMRVG